MEFEKVVFVTTIFDHCNVLSPITQGVIFKKLGPKLDWTSRL